MTGAAGGGEAIGAATEAAAAAATAAPRVLLNRRELAQAMRVTEPTIDRYRASGMPVVEGGSNGVPYKFALDDCLEWRRRRDEQDRELEEAKRRQIEEAQASLFGPGELPAIEGVALEDLSPAARKAMIEAHKQHLLLLEKMRRLVDVTEIDLLLGGALAKLSEAVRAVPELIGRRLALPAPVIAQLAEGIDAALETGVAEAKRVVREVRHAADA